MFHLLISLFLFTLQPNTADTDIRIKQHTQQLKTIAERDSFNTDFAILVDFSIPSKNYRYFVVDLHTGAVLIKGLCGHGGGKKDYGDEVVFSNQAGSLLSSEGKYLVGSGFNGTFGWSYRLYGLDATNSNALKRGIVLHAWKNIPDAENGKDCSLSNGCPMVSKHILDETGKLIDQSELPILMWIYK